MARKETAKRRNQRIKADIAGFFFLIPALVEGFIATLFLHLPFYEKFKTFLMEKVLTETMISDIETFFADLSVSGTEECILIAHVLLLFAAIILNFINGIICKRMVKKYDNGFLEFCKFMISTAGVITTVMLVIKFIKFKF